MSRAPRQRALPLLHSSYGLMRQTKTLQLISISLYSWSLQVAASPCWEMVLPDVISAILAWVLGPLPRDASLVPLSVSSQRVTALPTAYKVRHIRKNRCNATSTTRLISGRQSFRYVQAPVLASPPGCTYRTGFKSCWQPGRLRHAMTWRLPSRTVVSLHDRIGQLS